MTNRRLMIAAVFLSTCALLSSLCNAADLRMSLTFTPKALLIPGNPAATTYDLAAYSKSDGSENLTQEWETCYDPAPPGATECFSSGAPTVFNGWSFDVDGVTYG